MSEKIIPLNDKETKNNPTNLIDDIAAAAIDINIELQLLSDKIKDASLIEQVGVAMSLLGSMCVKDAHAAITTLRDAARTNNMLKKHVIPTAPRIITAASDIGDVPMTMNLKKFNDDYLSAISSAYHGISNVVDMHFSSSGANFGDIIACYFILDSIGDKYRNYIFTNTIKHISILPIEHRNPPIILSPKTISGNTFSAPADPWNFSQLDWFWSVNELFADNPQELEISNKVISQLRLMDENLRSLVLASSLLTFIARTGGSVDQILSEIEGNAVAARVEPLIPPFNYAESDYKSDIYDRQELIADTICGLVWVGIKAVNLSLAPTGETWNLAPSDCYAGIAEALSPGGGHSIYYYLLRLLGKSSDKTKNIGGSEAIFINEDGLQTVLQCPK